LNEKEGYQDMNKGLTFGAGLGLGTGIMFLLDPDRGRRRRALVRDKVVWAGRKTAEGMKVTAHDLRNRTQGIITGIESLVSSEPPEDSVLIERVRSKLGRTVSHPRALEVTAQNGVVWVKGPILAKEVDELLTTVKHIPGVNDVVNDLEVHEEADNHPALQGGRKRRGDRFEFMQENWSPAARFVAGAAGASLAVYGGTRRDALGAGLGAAGLLLLTRGITNTEFKRLGGLISHNAGGKQPQLTTGH
jgi:hypothetical protein